MKAMALNGSPRKKWSIAQLLNNALEGVKSQGAETELVNLYDFEYKGCKSCFSCKTIGNKIYGKCSIQDNLTPVLEEIKNLKPLY